MTEEINLKSLEKYQRLENEKKNTRTVRKTNVGPMIRYQSLSMPVMILSNSHKEKESKLPTDTDEGKADDSESKSTETNDNRYVV